MSKYKFLILILMVIKSLYYSEAIDFTDILRAKEVDGVFIKRMTERGLPIVGELYSEYQTRFNNNGQSASIISKEEYQILMDSIPRINESLESIKTRNDKINKEGSHVVHSFQQEDIDALKLYYPRVYETDIEYVRRLWRNNSVPFPLPKTIFKLLKSYCPNIGEIHNEYLEDRKNDFGIGGYSEQEFTVFLESYPTILENDATFLKRIGLESLGLDESNSSEYYLGLWSLIPIYAETYKEYSDRMKLKELVPMKRESFVFYQAYYPNLCVRYYDFKNQLSTYEQTEPRFQKLKFIIYSLKTYNHFKTKFPRPFESQKIFDNRSIDDSGYLHFIFKSSFAKRMYPKMTETYEDYLIRIALLDLKPIPEEYFIEYKKNYPQIHIAYDKIGFQYGKNENKKLQKESLLEIMMDEPEFGLLIRRLPIIYENYSMYRERITMLELLKFEEKEKKKTKYSHINSVTGEFDRSIKKIIEDDLTTGYDVEKTDPDYLDEEDFEDLKKVYINQCEIYKDYEIRMAQMHIIPMTIDIAKHFKMSVPREYEEYDGSYYDAIFNSDSNEFMKNNPNEYCFEFHWIQIFPDENYRTFLFVRPHLFENYENYVIRINTFRENYDFHDYTELKHLEQDTFRTFIQPLTKDEFSDLKLRFPKLSETPNDYEYRLRKEYGIKTVIVKNRFNLFNIIKQSQIQPCDNFEIYERRYNKLVINKKKHLQNLGILLLDIYQFNLFKKSLPTTPYEVDYSKYNEEMNKIRNKYKLDEEDYKDYMSVFPKYYDTFVEYNERMKNLYLDEIKFKDFEILKEVHPHFLDKDFDEYQCNHKSYKMTKEQYDLWFLSVPKPYESFKTYQTRVPNISDEIYKSGDFDRYKQIYPPASSTADEYFQLLESLGLPKIGSNVHSFNTYKKHLPIFKVDHTGKAPLYKDYTKSFENPKSYKMTKEQYDLWFLRLPKAHERYSSYEQRIKRIKKNNPPEVQPLEKYEFHDLKKLFSIPYETFEEHTSRLQRYGLIPLTVIQFKHEKAGRVLVGESYNSHVERILRLFSGDSIVIMDKEETLNNIKDEGVETLCPTIFVEHVLTYPFNYDTYEMFLSRQNKIKSELEPDPLVKTEIWYTTMKSLLPRINETIEKFKERVKTYDLDFPEITVTDFYRHKYTMPYPAESYSTFYERTNPDFFPIDPFSDNKILKVIPIPIPVQAENDTTVKWSPPKSKKSVRTVHARTSAIDTERPKHFQLCPVLNGFLKNYKRELYNNFIALSPNFVIDYKNYHDKVKKSNGEPLKLEEFYEFKRCIPKLQESILEYNNYMKSIGLAEIEVEGYNKLKIFYPRIHHISYNNYILDIELKFGKEAHDYRGVIDALKLSSNEFDVYKEYFPLLFDFTYTTYRTRKKHEDESKLFEMDEFNIIKKANLPLPDENYEQHKENMDYLAIDPIPNDVFLFLKGLYPELFDTRYKFRIMEMVCKELQHVNYNDDKYKLDNEIVSKIIKKSNPSKEQHDKVQTLMKHMLNDEDFKHLISHFPRVFQPYSSREDFMDEKLFKSFKKAYFPLINETYMEYTTRMKSLNLTAISSNIFRYIKSIYPQMYFQTTYLQKVKFYETHELRFVKASVTETLQRLGYEKFNQYNYDIFLNNIPRIFDSHTYFEKCVVKDQMPSIFNFDEFDSVKSAYYPRLSENYNSYRVRMVSIGLWMSNYEIFKSFKAVYPTPMMSYDEYKTAFNKKNGHKYKIKTQHIMTEKEFGNNLMNDFPRLFESWEEFYERRLPTSSEDTENRLINDDGIFSKNLFNDMKIVYLPKLGENVETFVLLNTETLNLSCDRQYWTKYFRNVMKLYPIFFESYADYKNRLKTRSECELEYLKLNEKWFYRFFQIFPFPYETYPQYTTRNVKETTYILSEEEFIYFRRVFPLLTETYIEYTARMNSNLCIQFVTKKIFVLFKLLFPQIDEDYDTYKKRFYNSLINSDDETKKQLSLFVQYMKFHAFDYKTSQDTEITPETSGDMNTAIITSEITDIAAETSGTTSVKIYGAMTFEEFKVFKLSLPIPNERRDDYIIRINKLASLAKRDGIKEHVEPEILPEELYQNLFDSYPKETNRNYDDYLENMECKNSIPVSRDTFDKLLKVSNSMDYNPYTFDYSSFYKIIVTSKDQLSYPSWPWYVDSGKQN